MNKHVVVKYNWFSSLKDQVSEFFWTWCVGAPLMAGVVVTGLGAAHGYLQAPQGESEVPYMVEGIKEYHINTWKTIGFMVEITTDVVNELRPEEVDQSSTDALPESPNPPVKPLPIPEPITNDVPDVGECDPYGPLDFSYDPPKLVCEVIHG